MPYLDVGYLSSLSTHLDLIEVDKVESLPQNVGAPPADDPQIYSNGPCPVCPINPQFAVIPYEHRQADERSSQLAAHLQNGMRLFFFCPCRHRGNRNLSGPEVASEIHLCLEYNKQMWGTVFASHMPVTGPRTHWVRRTTWLSRYRYLRHRARARYRCDSPSATRPDDGPSGPSLVPKPMPGHVFLGAHPPFLPVAQTRHAVLVNIVEEMERCVVL